MLQKLTVSPCDGVLPSFRLSEGSHICLMDHIRNSLSVASNAIRCHAYVVFPFSHAFIYDYPLSKYWNHLQLIFMINFFGGHTSDINERKMIIVWKHRQFGVKLVSTLALASFMNEYAMCIYSPYSWSQNLIIVLSSKLVMASRCASFKQSRRRAPF